MNKYHNKHTTVDGYEFDSLAEAQRYNDLKIMERAGLISKLKIHPRYSLLHPYIKDNRRVRGIDYEADFSYTQEGKEIAEDVKGVETEAFKIKRKLFDAKYPMIELRVVQS